MSGEAPGSPLPADVRPTRPLIFSITVTGIMANTLIAPALPDILDGLGAGDDQAGLVLAAATLPGILMAPVAGVAADRYGRRAVLVPCLVLFGLSGGLAALAPSFAVRLLCRFLQGVGSAALLNRAVVLIGDHWDGVDRTRVIGQNSAVLTVSLVALPPLGGLLTAVGGWRSTFVPYLLALGTAVVIARRLPDRRRSDVDLVAQLRAAAGVVRTPAVVAAIGLGAVAFMLIFGLILTALPLYVEDEFGLDPAARGLVLGLPAITSTVAALSLPRIRARRSPPVVLVTTTLVMAVAFALIASAPSLPMVAVGALVFGLGDGALIPTLQDLVTAAAPAESRGSVVAAWVGSARAGQTVGPVLAGVGVARLGAPWTFAIGSAVAGATAVAQAAAGAAGRKPAVT